MAEETRVPSETIISRGSGSGSIIIPNYVERTMTFYPVQVREMRELSLINTASVAFFSIGSFMLSLAIGFRVGAVFADPGHISAQGEDLRDFGAPVSLLIAVVLYVVGIGALILRGRTIDEIRKESRQVTAEIRIESENTA